MGGGVERRMGALGGGGRLGGGVAGGAGAECEHRSCESPDGGARRGARRSSERYRERRCSAGRVCSWRAGRPSGDDAGASEGASEGAGAGHFQGPAPQEAPPEQRLGPMWHRAGASHTGQRADGRGRLRWLGVGVECRAPRESRQGERQDHRDQWLQRSRAGPPEPPPDGRRPRPRHRPAPAGRGAERHAAEHQAHNRHGSTTERAALMVDGCGVASSRRAGLCGWKSIVGAISVISDMMLPASFNHERGVRLS
mmetsp:Transcript_167027/g.536307  ORF Transcript_167027/g.536307 Transcript_167027/m.536307 type:complete len:254 (+) Transcript_167027:265-1026(+)